jgi:hypothetical protein
MELTVVIVVAVAVAAVVMMMVMEVMRAFVGVLGVGDDAGHGARFGDTVMVDLGLTSRLRPTCREFQ